MNTDHTTTYKDAFQEVKECIFDRKIPHDQEITAENIALKVGMETGRLQLVLDRLVQERILLQTAPKTYRVRQFTDGEVVELYDARIALQSLGAKMFATRAAQPRIDDLRSLLIPFGKGPTNPKIYNKIDYHFHGIIMKHTGNPFLWDIFNAGNILSYMALIGLVRPPKEIFDEHLNIVSAFHKREAELAAFLMKQHLERSKWVMLDKF